VLEEVRQGVERRLVAGRPRPHLSVVLVGHHPASETYVRHKHRDAEQVGITSSDHRLLETASTEEVVELVEQLNADEAVSGILVQTPLPAQVDATAAVEAVDPARDVDGLHPLNQGRLLRDQDGLAPCTPSGIIRLLDDHEVEFEGRRAVVIGRSNLVGKPTAVLLLRRNATVTICHSRTADLGAVTREADVLVAAAGRAGLVTREMVAPGAVVVDVATNFVDGKLTGDVTYEEVAEIAGAVSPVPGGVGPLTNLMLGRNLLEAARLQASAATESR
jgi:methylenetetrahydrofolate dehydrogenase (NADP+)/methenyltetrahydrofolate cyclohydrolase